MPDDQESLTDEEKAKKASEVEFNNKVNSAVTAHLKRVMKNDLPAAIAEALKPFGEQIAALKAPPIETDKDTSKKQIDPEVAAMKQKLDDALKAIQVSEEKRATAEKKAREDRAFSDFKSHLGKTVRPDMLDMVARDLFHNQALVEVDEDGTAYFKGGQDPYGEDVRFPLQDGVENWLKGDSAKPFLPPAGSSTTPPVPRRTVQAPGAQPPIDLDKASPLQKLQAADVMAKRMQAALAAKGINVT